MKKVKKTINQVRKTTAKKKSRSTSVKAKAKTAHRIKILSSNRNKKSSAKANVKKAAKARPITIHEFTDSSYIHPKAEDPAHMPGHRKMNLKEQFQKGGSKTRPQNDSARNHMTRENNFKRTSAANRRIITGAAVGKTGRISIK